MAYHRHHGLEVRIVRIFNTYGPRMRARDGRVVSNFLVQALRGQAAHRLRRRHPDPELLLRRRRDPRVPGPARQRPHRPGQHRQPGRVHHARARRAGEGGHGVGVADRLRAPSRRRPDAAPARHHPRPHAAGLGADDRSARGPRAHRRRTSGRSWPPDSRSIGAAMDEGRRLTDEEAAHVFRRATELDRDGLQRPGGWLVDDLVEVGREVGISPDAIRRAVAELAPVADGPSLEVAARGPVVRCLRVVPVRVELARREVDSWLQTQLFEAVRDRPDSAVYERRRDRKAWRVVVRDRDGQYRMRPVDRVLVAVAPVPGDAGSTSIRIEAELRHGRGDRAVDAAKGWAGWAVVGGGALVLFTTPVWLLAAPVVAAGIGGAAWRRAGGEVEAERAAVELAVEGALDRLERLNH